MTRLVKSVGLLSLHIFLCQTPSSVALVHIRKVTTSAFHRRQSKKVSLRNGVSSSNATNATSGTNATVVGGWPLDLAKATESLTKFEQLTIALDQNTTNMTTELAELVVTEGVTGLNLASAMNKLGKVEVYTTANKAFAKELSNRSLLVEADLRANARQLRSLRKQYVAEDSNYKMLSAAGGGLSNDVVNLERAVNATLPGRDTIAARLNKTEAEIKFFKETLELGVSKNVGFELKDMLDGVRTEVQNLTFELKRRRVIGEK